MYSPNSGFRTDHVSRRCFCNECDLYCVRTSIWRKPEWMQLERAKSMIRYWPPNGTAGFVLSLVSGARRDPMPPARTMLTVSEGQIIPGKLHVPGGVVYEEYVVCLAGVRIPKDSVATIMPVITYFRVLLPTLRYGPDHRRICASIHAGYRSSTQVSKPRCHTTNADHCMPRVFAAHFAFPGIRLFEKWLERMRFPTRLLT